MYMRQIEPWLDATGWGKTWPSLNDKDPDPECVGPHPHNSDDAGPVVPMQGDQANEVDGESGDEDSGEDTDMSEAEDDDGGDPEQPEDDDSDSDDEDSGGNKGTRSREDGEGRNNGDEAEDEAEEYSLEFTSL